MADPAEPLDPKDAHAYVEEMRGDVTLDWFFQQNPATLTDERLRELIEIERDKRAAFISAKEQR